MSDINLPDMEPGTMIIIGDFSIGDPRESSIFVAIKDNGDEWLAAGIDYWMVPGASMPVDAKPFSRNPISSADIRTIYSKSGVGIIDIIGPETFKDSHERWGGHGRTVL